jgi:hypothetical protein
MLGRLKFEIAPMVNDLLAHIPPDILINGTILDPAMGGGQFVKEVERIKRAAGKSDDEIRNTVFGIEDNILRRDYAVNKHNLVGTYSVGKFLEKAFNIKFDVILGGPPFHDDSTNLKGNLWSQYIIQSEKLIVDQGFIAFVTPPSWMSGTNDNGNKKKKQIQNIFTKNHIHYLNLDVHKHFAGVGSLFSAYVLQKTNVKGLTKVISNGIESDLDLHGFKVLPKRLNSLSLSIVNKFIDYPIKKPFTAVGCVGYPKPEGQEQYKIYNTGNNFASSRVEPGNARNRKVVVSVPSKLVAVYDDGVYGCSINSGWTPVVDQNEAQKYIQAVASKFIQFIFAECKYSGFNNILLLKSFPEIKDSSDSELYKQFNLTSEEIAYIND